MSVASEYFKVYSEYSCKYGQKTAVLMQVGSFYEIYGIDNEKQKVGNAVELSQLLNIMLTRKNKKILQNDIHNPLLLGFPCLALSKYIPVFLSEQYTVVVLDQVKTGVGFRRAVVDVISPSTYIDSTHDDSYLVCIYIDKHKHVGMSAISVLTGNSTVHECYSDPNDKDMPLDDALGFIKQYRPKEVVIHRDSSNNDKYLMSYLELDNILCHWIEVKKSSYSPAYQNAMLGCAFENNSMLSNIEYLDLERMPYALLSYVLLIEFVHGHNPMLLVRMSKPNLWTHNEHLVLSTSTLDQLNVNNSSNCAKTHTLFNVINKCCTKAGKRLLLKRLTAPIAKGPELQKRYDQIEEFGILFGNDTQKIEQILKKISDIERLHRRLVLGILTPAELATIIESYSNILKLDTMLKNSGVKHLSCMMPEQCAKLQKFIDTCEYAFDMSTMHTFDSETVSFNTGVFKDIDVLKCKVDFEMNAINKFAGKISDYGIEGVRVDYMQNVGYYVTVSSARAKKIPHNNNIIIKSNKTVAKVTSPDIDAANKKLQSLNAAFKTCTKSKYKKTLKYFSTYADIFKGVTDFLSNVDVARSNYKIKVLYNYCRPTIVKQSTCFVNAKCLRHAIMERIDDGNEYIPNDISLGCSYGGMILYSMNSCGKTSLLKALGLSVILAQAGCFVPASSFSICPFRCIMTRILSRDNIMKGQSSFVAEMSELRAILKRAVNSSTLVLADEITHGTEHTSGSAIFVSSVETLAQRNVNFMFTTHLHNVYPFVRNIHNVRTYHLSVTFDSGKIVFERKLKDGPGGSIYGLEVCEHLNMDVAFLARAFQIRNTITPDKTEKAILAKHSYSRYNKNKIKIACECCGYSPRLPTDIPLHTHHIKEQHTADQHNMIDGVHKDAVSNLMVLCKQCHDKKHQRTTTTQRIFGL
jgi:DNA mismatch repair protein MutS